MLTATCGNCGSPKDPANYRDNYCPGCTSAKTEAEQHFASEHPQSAESDILYAGRQALMSRAHRARANYLDPGRFAASRGTIPTRPETT